MPFIASTINAPSAVLGVQLMQIAGTEGTYVVMQRLNGLTLFRNAAEPDGDAVFVQDFPLHCTLKYMRAVPIFDPETRQFHGHILFLLSIKQEICIVAFSATSGSARMAMVALFTSDVEECFYQFSLGETDMCCCTSMHVTQATLTPFVAFTVSRGEVYFLDVLAAVGSGPSTATTSFSKLRGAGACQKSFATASIMNFAKQRSAMNPICKSCFASNEVEVKDIAFGFPRLHTPEARRMVPFYVLYTDRYGRTHVSDSNLYMDREAVSKPQGVSLLTNEDLFGAHGASLVRIGDRQSNVDDTAGLIIVGLAGMFVVGRQLITLIEERPRKCVTTQDMGLPVSVGEVACACLVSEEVLLVCFANGFCVRVEVQRENARVGTHREYTSLRCTFRRQLDIFPFDIVAVDDDRCVVSSRFNDTVVVGTKDLSVRQLLIKHCGPIMGMEVVTDGPQMCVITNSGTGDNGGLSVIRRAVSIVEDFNLHIDGHVFTLLAAHNLLVLVLYGSNRYFLLDVTEASFTEVSVNLPTLPSAFPVLSIHYTQLTACYTAVSHNHLTQFRITPEGVVEVGHVHLHDSLTLATACDSFTVVCSCRQMTVLKDLQVHSTYCPAADLSCVGVIDETMFGFGIWDMSFSIYDVVHSCVAATLALSADPRSICTMPGPVGCHRIFVGLHDGHLIETSLALAMEGRLAHDVSLMNTAIELRGLPVGNALLCLGNIPLVVILDDDGFQLTGLGLLKVCGCATLSGPESRYAFFSQHTSTLCVGTIDRVQKFGRTIVPLGFTVSQVRYIASWGGFIVSLYLEDGDKILFLPFSAVECPWESYHPCMMDIPLQEKKRCVCIEPILLDGVDKNGRTAVNMREELHNDNAVLVGSAFMFPTERHVRCSYIAWYRHNADLPGELEKIGGMDIEGALQCCCPVPHCPGLVAFGVNGCVMMYRWNATDTTLVLEATCRIGLMITKLLPVCGPPEDQRTSIIALDVRFSAFFLTVDARQSEIKVVTRDRQLLSVMDGAVLPPTHSPRLCMSDDRFNIFCVHKECIAAPSNQSSDGAIPVVRLTKNAQYHLGDLVTCIQSCSTESLPRSAEGVPMPVAVLDGDCEQQVLYGTAHGAMGTLTPISGAAYLFLRSLEQALEEVAGPSDSFQHARFREVLSNGQERGWSQSQCVGVSSHSTLLQRHGTRHARTGVCDGNMLSTYLLLDHATCEIVLMRAQDVTLKWLAAMGDDSKRYLGAGGVLEEVSALLAISNESDLIERCNTIFAADGLPTIPYHHDQVERFLQALKHL